MLQPGSRTRADVGVGHDDVQAAELADALVDDGSQRGPVTDVGLTGDDAAVIPSRRRCRQR